MKKVINIFLAMVLVGILILIAYKLAVPKDNHDPLVNLPMQNEKRVKIGVSLGTLKEERWFKDRDILMSKVQELGAEIYVHNANNDDLDQINQVKSLIEEGIDVLILVPNDMTKAAQAVQLAKKSGVKVISYDRLVMDKNVDCYISFDNKEVGRIMAEALVQQVPQGSYLIINGAPTDHNTTMIKEGYDEVLGPYIKSGDITIVEEAWANNWMREEAFDVTDRLLTDHEEISAVLAGNDSLAEGAVNALSQHRLATDAVVVGQDADLSACQRIVNDLQLMTVYKPIDELAAVTAKVAVKLALDEPIETDRTISVNGAEIPYYVLEPIPIYRQEVDDIIIHDGFHRQSEIYLGE
ncbi:MAG: substrate-binding domain-containing protein [Clostridia bacterium]|nr:substrate-binding domain-containing protein [Clostridia bacterium]